ncbi:MAG TPA: ABC transporter ATP-binding protein [Pyrinomonadaceae bacterium]|nr:ABC transporter ATP-binding protein [Pyrinomonadaceae bacterium]
MLKIKDLTKTYPSGVQALKGVSLELSPGVFGLLGPNGSGKSTLMKILATLLEPDSGTIEMNDVDLIARKDHTRRMLGYLPQEFGLYPTLTARQMLDYLAKLKGISNKRERHALIEALLERVNLSLEPTQPLGEFSGGMRQRLGIAQALIGDPQLIIVDEPTAGLDPQERVRFHNLISETAGESTVVILSTHIVSDVSNLCSRMAIIQQGKIVSESTPQQAVDKLKDAVWEATVPREQLSAFKSRSKVISSRMFDGQARLRVISKDQRPSEEFTPAMPILEDYYLDLVNQAA